MKVKRQSTVEPVFGTLTQFMGMRKVNTIGLEQANKCMHMAAMAYNLKKYLKFIQKKQKSVAKTADFIVRSIIDQIEAILSDLIHPKNKLKLEISIF